MAIYKILVLHSVVQGLFCKLFQVLLSPLHQISLRGFDSAKMNGVITTTCAVVGMHLTLTAF